MKGWSANAWEVSASLLLVAIGVYVAWRGIGLSLGTPQRPGSGAVPFGLGLGLVGFGGAILVESLRENAPRPDFVARPFATVLLAVVTWAVLAPRLGLVPATISLVLICAFAQRPARLLGAAISAAVLSAASVLIFLIGLRIPLNAFNW